MIKRYLINQLFTLFIVISSFLFFIVLFNQLFLVLKDSISIPFFFNEIFIIVLLKSITDLPLLISISFFFAILIFFNRIQKNSEIYIFESAGLGKLKLAKLISPLISYVFLIILLISNILSPVLEKKIIDFRENAKANISRIELKKGIFNVFNNGKLTIYTENIDEGKNNESFYSNILIHFENKNSKTLILARKGNKFFDNKDSILSLDDGSKYLFEKDKTSVTNFKSLKINLSRLRKEINLPNIINDNLKIKHFFELMTEEDSLNKGEVYWRLSLPFSVITLSLIALYISPIIPRSKGNKNILFGMMILFVYFSGSLIVKSAIEEKSLSFALGFFFFHSLFYIYLLIYSFFSRTKLNYKYEKIPV